MRHEMSISSRQWSVFTAQFRVFVALALSGLIGQDPGCIDHDDALGPDGAVFDGEFLQRIRIRVREPVVEHRVRGAMAAAQEGHGIAEALKMGGGFAHG